MITSHLFSAPYSINGTPLPSHPFDIGTLPCDTPGPFVLVTGSGTVSVSGTAPTTVATSGTGKVSELDFLTWSNIGPDGTTTGTTYSDVSSLSATGITVTLVNNDGTAWTGIGILQRLSSGPVVFNDNFTTGEPLLFVNAPASGLFIDFDPPISGVGARFQSNDGVDRTDFFFKAYSGATLLSSNMGLAVPSSVSSVDSAPFYGVAQECCASQSVTRIFIGFSGDDGPLAGWAISTLEFFTPSCICPDGMMMAMAKVKFQRELRKAVRRE